MNDYCTDNNKENNGTNDNRLASRTVSPPKEEPQEAD
jgi:hypothetical protein